MRFGKIGNYWNQTETFEALQVYIDMNFDNLKDDILSMIAGEKIPVNTGSFANELAEELMDFEEENIERLKRFL